MTVIQMMPKKKPVFKNERNYETLEKIVTCEIRYSQFKDETPYKILVALTEWIGDQLDFHVSQLKNLSAIFEIYDIVTVGYDETSIVDVLKGIQNGTHEPTKWNSFVIDRNLNHKGWPIYKVIKEDGETRVEVCK